MSKITKRALIPSLIASALAGPALASQGTGHDTDSASAARLLEDGRVRDQTVAFLRRTQSASSADAEDAAQEAAVRALTRGIRSDSPRSFASWMRRTAKNHLLDTMRKKREKPLSTDAEESGNPSSWSSSRPGELFELRDQLESLLARHDIETMSVDKKAQLGNALGEHLLGDGSAAKRLQRSVELVEQLRPVLAELAEHG